jgi:hypothetical protein
MPRTKPSTLVGPGGMKRRLQLATRDSRSPSVVAPKVVTAANVARNEACVPGCNTAAVGSVKSQILLTVMCLRVPLVRPSPISMGKIGRLK